MKVSDAIADLGESAEPQGSRRQRRARAAAEPEPTETTQVAETPPEAAPAGESTRAEEAQQVKQSLDSDPKGAIEFKDRDVVISSDDIVLPDVSRLEEKEKEEPEVTKNVMAQIEERRRRLESGE